jgi:hypothetical protein
VLDRIMRTVRSGRQKLQAISSPRMGAAAEPPPARADADAEEIGFFDQDIS